MYNQDLNQNLTTSIFDVMTCSQDPPAFDAIKCYSIYILKSEAFDAIKCYYI